MGRGAFFGRAHDPYSFFPPLPPDDQDQAGREQWQLDQLGCKGTKEIAVIGVDNCQDQQNRPQGDLFLGTQIHLLLPLL